MNEKVGILSKNNQLNNQLTSLNQTIGTLSTKNNQLENQLTSLNNEKINLYKEIKEIKRLLNEHKIEIDKLKKIIGNKQITIDLNEVTIKTCGIFIGGLW